MIKVFIDSNENTHARMLEFRDKVRGSPKVFEEPIVTSSISSDLRFDDEGKVYNVELKDFSEEENSDILSSIMSGHLFKQALQAQKMQEPYMILALGEKEDLYAAIRNAALIRKGGRSQSIHNTIAVYHNLVKSFRRACWKANIPVFFVGESPWFDTSPVDIWKDLLHYIEEIFELPSLVDFRPKPTEGEEDTAALCMYLQGTGVGPIKARAILDRFDGMPNFFRHYLDPGFLDELKATEGIGPKTAKAILEAMVR